MIGTSPRYGREVLPSPGRASGRINSLNPMSQAWHSEIKVIHLKNRLVLDMLSGICFGAQVRGLKPLFETKFQLETVCQRTKLNEGSGHRRAGIQGRLSGRSINRSFGSSPESKQFILQTRKMELK